MSIRRAVIALLALCAIVILFSFAGLASDFVTRLLRSVDGLLLLMICLLMGGIFSLMAFILLKETGLLPLRHMKPAGGPSQGASGAAPAGKSPQEQTAGITR